MTNHDLTTDTPHKSRRVRVGFCSALALVTVMALSGGAIVVGGTAASASSNAHAKTSTKKTLKKFEKCLKKHGVKSSFPGSGGPPSGAPSGTFPSGGGAPGGGAPGGFKISKRLQKALKACSHLLPAGSQFGGGSAPPTNGSTAFAAFRNCMTINHVTLAKGSYGAKSPTTAVTPTSSSKYKKAYSSCSSLLPKSPTAST
jgi:hypothetical protein